MEHTHYTFGTNDFSDQEKRLIALRGRGGLFKRIRERRIAKNCNTAGEVQLGQNEKITEMPAPAPVDVKKEAKEKVEQIQKDIKTQEEKQEVEKKIEEELIETPPADKELPEPEKSTPEQSEAKVEDPFKSAYEDLKKLQTNEAPEPSKAKVEDVPPPPEAPKENQELIWAKSRFETIKTMLNEQRDAFDADATNGTKLQKYRNSVMEAVDQRRKQIGAGAAATETPVETGARMQELRNQIIELQNDYLQPYAGITIETPAADTPPPPETEKSPPEPSDKKVEDEKTVELTSKQLDLVQNLESQKQHIIGALQAIGMNGIELFAEIDDQYTVEELVLPKNREQLIRQQMHMRELEKVAEAGEKSKWGPLEGNGIAYGENKVYMYKLDLRNQKLLAFDAPGDYQELDLKTGKWSWPGDFNAEELSTKYESVMTTVDKNHHTTNTELEQGLKNVDENRIKKFADTPANWTVENGAVLERLGFKRAEQAPEAGGKSPPKSVDEAPEADPLQIQADAEAALVESKRLFAEVSANGEVEEARTTIDEQIKINNALMRDVENAASEIATPAENLIQQLSAVNADLQSLFDVPDTPAKPVDAPPVAPNSAPPVAPNPAPPVSPSPSDIPDPPKAPEDTAPENIDFPAAKDAPTGEIRKDKEGNYWIKQEDRMWGSYNNPEEGMTSNSGFKGTEWGDSLMDDNTAEIVMVKEDSEKAPEDIEKTPEQMIDEKIGRLIELAMENESNEPTNDPNLVDAETRTKIENGIEELLDNSKIETSDIADYLYKSSYYKYEDGELVAIIEDDEEAPEKELDPLVQKFIDMINNLLENLGLSEPGDKEDTEKAEELDVMKKQLEELKEERTETQNRWDELMALPSILTTDELNEIDRVDEKLVMLDKKIAELEKKVADLEANKETPLTEEEQKIFDSLPDSEEKLNTMKSKLETELKEAEADLKEEDISDAQIKRINEKIAFLKVRIKLIDKKLNGDSKEAEKEVEFADDTEMIALMDKAGAAAKLEGVEFDVVDSEIYINLDEEHLLTGGQQKVLTSILSEKNSVDSELVTIIPTTESVWEKSPKGEKIRQFIAGIMGIVMQYEGDGSDFSIDVIMSKIDIPAGL